MSGSAQKVHGNNLKDSILLATHSMANYRFSEADQVVIRLTNNYPENSWVNLLRANYDWWQIISGNDSERLRKEFRHSLDVALSQIEKDNTGSNEDLYTLITVYAYKTRIEVLNGNYFKAAVMLNNAISYMKLSFGKEKEYEWFNLTSGIYNYYLAYAKKQFPLLLPYLMFLPDADRQEGIALLNKAKASGNELLSTEAGYFLMKIFLEQENSPNVAWQYAHDLTANYPDNALYHYYAFKSLLDQRKVSRAQDKLTQLKKIVAENPQLSIEQKSHFIKMAEEDLSDYNKKLSLKTDRE